MQLKKLQSRIEKLIKKHNIILDKLFLVPDMQQFLDSEGITEENQDRLGRTFSKADGHTVIIFKDNIIKKETKSVLGFIIYNFSIEEYKKLTRIKPFILHLILHEIAHAKNIHEEKDADNWAFQNLDQEYRYFWHEPIK
ncbi:MAG TPA: hypothetical protein VMR41_05955 [Patescibacteria group bacterium]|nr:hypothetical protein [Patescibacteria group bacterium]